jgi:putative ABC transport system permease protein
MSAARAAFRLARRDALRHRWRSLLIVILILAPVAAATGVDVIYRTQTSPALEKERAFGGADAAIYLNYGEDARKGVTQDQIEAALPTGSRVVYQQAQRETVFTAPGHLAGISYLITDHLGDPLIRQRVRLESGQAPHGNEVAISPKVADKLGLEGDGIGSTIALRDGTSAKVSSSVRDPFCLSCPIIVVPTGSEMATALNQGVTGPLDGAFYVDLPPGDNSAAVVPLQELGAYVQLRENYQSYEIGLGDLGRAGEDQLKAAALVTLVAGLGLLEVVLLAGTAFAVGARRQTRDLGMIAAQGGSPGDLRRVVLAQGLLLGLIGAVTGVLAGIGGVLAAKPLLERINNEVMVGVHFGMTEVLIVAMIGVASGLAAALFPAITAGRRSTVDALASRFPVPTARSKWAPLFGGVLIAGGVTLSLLASYLMSGDGSIFGPQLVETSAGRGRLDDTSGSIAILVGVFIVVGGLLLVAPALLALLAKLAGRLPATMRLATRDAARHRHRTGPATAAIAVAVGGAVAISCLIASDREGKDRFEAHAVPDRVIALDKQNAVDSTQMEAATAAVQRVIPGATVLQVMSPAVPVPDDSPAVSTRGDRARPAGLICADDCSQMYVRDPSDSVGGILVGIGDPDLVVLASGRVVDRAAAAAALDAGKAIVFDADLIDDGKITIETGLFDDDGSAKTVTTPAVALSGSEPYNELPQAFVPTSFVAAQKWETVQGTTLLSYPPESREQAGAAIAAAEALGIPVISSAEEKDYTRLVRVGLTAAAALIALLGVAMCVALSAAEGRPDLATLSAIGAPPGRRRRLAGAQALVLAGIGVVLGLGFGFYFARAARPATGASATIVPWSDLMLTVAAVPLLAVLVAMLGSVGRVPLTRRAD